MNDCVIFMFWPQIIPGVEWFPNVLNHVPAILCVLKPSEQCIWRAVLFSLIFSLTAKARLKLAGSQAVQHSASPAQKRTAKHAKTGLENRKTGSSPVLSTIKLNQKRCQREKPRSFNDFWAFLRPIFEVGKKDIKKGFGKISGLEPLRTRFWAAFPEFFRESGSFLSSAKCRILTGVFVGVAG